MVLWSFKYIQCSYRHCVLSDSIIVTQLSYKSVQCIIGLVAHSRPVITYWKWEVAWGTLQHGTGGPWRTRNFGWVGHSAFGPTNNWPVCSLILHCGPLLFGKVSKIVDARCQIWRLTCTEFAFCWCSASDPAWWAYSAYPCLIALFKGPTSKRGEGKLKGRGGGGRIWPTQKFWCGTTYEKQLGSAIAKGRYS